jgi:hypothetical protein
MLATSSITANGGFYGNGAGISGITASGIVDGAIIPGKIANGYYNLGSSTFTMYSLTATKLYGDGSGLTGIPGSTNMVTTDTNQTITGNKTFTSSMTVTSASGVYSAGDVNLATGKQYKINGSQIGSSNLSDSSNIDLLNGNQAVTGIKTFTRT